MKWAVLMVAGDGTQSVAGPFATAHRAESFGRFAEAHVGVDAYPLPLTPPTEARTEILDAYYAEIDATETTE